MEAVQTVSKAIAGALAAAVVGYATRHGIVVDAGVSEALAVVIAAVVGFVVVYFAPKNKESK